MALLSHCIFSLVGITTGLAMVAVANAITYLFLSQFFGYEASDYVRLSWSPLMALVSLRLAVIGGGKAYHMCVQRWDANAT